MPSMIVAVSAALGLGLLWGVLIVSLCQAAKDGDRHLEAEWDAEIAREAEMN